MIRPQSPLLDFHSFPEQRRGFAVTSPRAPHGIHFPNGEALLASNTTYTITITGVKDTAGNQMAGYGGDGYLRPPGDFPSGKFLVFVR